MSLRVNIGCGQTPTEGWNNYDNSFAIRIAGIPIVSHLASKIGLLSESQAEFVNFARNSNIKWADATKHIPESDRSVEVLYSSHMLEHLDRKEAVEFLKEARRVLIHGGIIRLAVPNLKFHIENYLDNKDADLFIENILLTKEKPKSTIDKIKTFLVGDRHHMWMYDGDSLCKLLSSSGFRDSKVMELGSTTILNPGSLNLEERSEESIFV